MYSHQKESVRDEMEEPYTRRRLDRMAEDVAITRNKVESIERLLSAAMEETRGNQDRLGLLERKVFALWVIGPILVGGAIVLQSLRTWLTEH